MISNEKQLKITKKRLEQFKESLQILKNDKNKEALLKELQANALESSIEEFEKDIKEYEALKSGQIKSLTIEKLDEFPMILIKGRISKGLTQKQLASVLSLNEQQIQRYESNLYAGISMEQALNIFNALEIKNTAQTFTFRKHEFDLPENITQDKIQSVTRQIQQSKTLFAF